MEEEKKEKNKEDSTKDNSNNQKEISEFHNEKYKKKSEYPNFLLKLYQILENPDYKDIIEWSNDGKYFIVKNLHDFTENVLPKYYKHNNYSSFIRQLNMYDFHKKKGNPNDHIFEHTYFIKNRKDLLKFIKRKSKKEPNIIINDINNNINYNTTNNNQMLTQYPNFYINNTNNINNKFFPTNKKEFLPYYPNQPLINNSINGTKLLFKNDGKSPFQINQNTENNSMIHKNIPLLPMGYSLINNNNINNNNINNINNNIINNPQEQNNININEEKEEKKITKKNLQNLLTYLMHSIDQNTETQKQLQQKIEILSNQNEEFISQNKKILQEIVTKNEYNQRLEAVICFILEMIMSKSKMKNNQELKNLFISNEPNLNKGNLFNNNSGSILEPYQAFFDKYYERSKNGDIPKFNNNNILLEDDNKYYIQNLNQINAENLKKNLIGTGNEDALSENNINNNNNNYPIVLSNKRKRSSSFNSILSNLSRGSNVYFNNSNKKLLKSEEDEKKEPEKNNEKKENEENENNNTIKRKDSISSFNDNNKDVFDLDMSQDENKSFFNGYNKDLLNNSQTSFNDIFGNANMNNTFSDINN